MPGQKIILKQFRCRSIKIVLPLRQLLSKSEYELSRLNHSISLKTFSLVVSVNFANMTEGIFDIHTPKVSQFASYFKAVIFIQMGTTIGTTSCTILPSGSDIFEEGRPGTQCKLCGIGSPLFSHYVSQAPRHESRLT